MTRNNLTKETAEQILRHWYPKMEQKQLLGKLKREDWRWARNLRRDAVASLKELARI